MTFENNKQIIINGDAVDVLQNQIADNSVDLIFVDPPYNIGKDFCGLKDKWKTEDEYLEWCYQWIGLCINKLKDN